MHRNIVRRALRHLFEAPIEEFDTIARAVLQSVLGPKQIDVSQKVLDLRANEHLVPLVKAEVSPVVCEDEVTPSWKTVLETFETEGQELLFEWMDAHSLYFSLSCSSISYMLFLSA